MARSDEYVLEALLTFDKLGVVVHELLAIEAWKEVRLVLYAVCSLQYAVCCMLDQVIYRGATATVLYCIIHSAADWLAWHGRAVSTVWGSTLLIQARKKRNKNGFSIAVELPRSLLAIQAIACPRPAPMWFKAFKAPT